MKNDKEIIAYLAGAIDSDGCITIKKSSYSKRVRKDSYNYTYQEVIHLKQVTPQIPQLLQEMFKGSLRTSKGQTINSKPLYYWQVNCILATNALRLLLPYLRVKKKQAELALELRESKDSKYLKHSYWYNKAHPNWREYELIDYEETRKIMNYASIDTVSQAVCHGTILALPFLRNGRSNARVCKPFIEMIAKEVIKSKDKRLRTEPNELVNWKNDLWQKVRDLNKIGKNGTNIYNLEFMNEVTA